MNVFGGQTVRNMEDADAEKYAPYYIHISHISIGKVVTSSFAKAQVVIHRAGEQSFELVIRRSFANYIGFGCRMLVGSLGFR